MRSQVLVQLTFLLSFAFVMSPAFALESLNSSRSVSATIGVSDRVYPQFCNIGVGPDPTSTFTFDDLCSVDTGYGFGQIDVSVEAQVVQSTFRTSGTVSSSVMCSNGDPWGGAVDKWFDWEAVEDFHLKTQHVVRVTGNVNVPYSLDDEYGRIEVLVGPEFVDVAWSLSIPSQATTTLDEQFMLAAGDYRYVFLLHHEGGSTCDLVNLDFDVSATFETTVSVKPTSFTAVKGLYR